MTASGRSSDPSDARSCDWGAQPCHRGQARVVDLKYHPWRPVFLPASAVYPLGFVVWEENCPLFARSTQKSFICALKGKVLCLILDSTH